jgi:undecaprenyl pyrophosphate synthase
MALPKLNNARYDIVIPSTGKTVSYRPYLVKEEKILMMAMETNDEKQIMNATKDVIKSCVHDDINVDDLAMFDVESTKI